MVLQVLHELHTTETECEEANEQDSGDETTDQDICDKEGEFYFSQECASFQLYNAKTCNDCL